MWWWQELGAGGVGVMMVVETVGTKLCCWSPRKRYCALVLVVVVVVVPQPSSSPGRLPLFPFAPPLLSQ